MKLQELLAIKGINLERTKLIRHNMSNEESKRSTTRTLTE